jgi:hypothetical protein
MIQRIAFVSYLKQKVMRRTLVRESTTPRALKKGAFLVNVHYVDNYLTSAQLKLK